MTVLKTDLGGVDRRIAETEQRISDNTDDLRMRRAEVGKLWVENETMKSKILERKTTLRDSLRLWSWTLYPGLELHSPVSL